MEENRTKDQIFAEALAAILENQIRIKVHFGLARDDTYYGDCHSDYKIIEDLNDIE